FERANTVLENLEQITIAMINGHAVGGGWGLTLACDFRWAAAEAEMWIPEVDLGVPLGVASTTRFVRLVGPAVAKEIILQYLRYLRGGNGMSAPFAACNRNKRGIAVDLQKPEGAALVFELARRADVVIENFLPGVAAKLGLGYARISAANPRAVYASITGFG